MLKPKKTHHDFSQAKGSDPPPAPVHYPYSVMTGSFKTLERADRHISHLKDKGFEAFWTKVNLGEQGIWFRVCVGHFETQRATEEFEESSGFKEGKIVRTAYANKIANFASKDEAQKTVASLRNAGHSPYVLRDPQEGYRVLIGAHVAKESADDMVGKLKQAGIDSTAVFR